MVVHDELDLPPAVLRVKAAAAWPATTGCARSRPPHAGDFVPGAASVWASPRGASRGADHVLRRFSKAEREQMDVTVEEAADAVECIVTDGVEWR